VEGDNRYVGVYRLLSPVKIAWRAADVSPDFSQIHIATTKKLKHAQGTNNTNAAITNCSNNSPSLPLVGHLGHTHDEFVIALLITNKKQSFIALHTTLAPSNCGKQLPSIVAPALQLHVTPFVSPPSRCSTSFRLAPSSKMILVATSKVCVNSTRVGGMFGRERQRRESTIHPKELLLR
jgi:hypothetical protein